MADPTPGTPAPTEQATSTQTATEQASGTTIAPVKTPTPAQPTGTAAPAATQQQTDAAQLQEQLSKLQAERNQLDQNFKQLQGAFTQSRQQLAALTGVQAPQDPLAPMVQSIMSKGITDDAKQARSLAEFVSEAMAPIMQNAQRANAVTQSAFAVEQSMRGAVAKAPQLFVNPQVAQQVHEYLRQDAMNGNAVNEDYALQLAKIAYADAVVLATQQNPNARPAAPQLAPNFASMWGPPGGFTPPPQQQQKQISPEAAAVDAEIAARFPGKKTT